MVLRLAPHSNRIWTPALPIIHSHVADQIGHQSAYQDDPGEFTGVGRYTGPDT